SGDISPSRSRAKSPPQTIHQRRYRRPGRHLHPGGFSGMRRYQLMPKRRRGARTLWLMLAVCLLIVAAGSVLGAREIYLGIMPVSSNAGKQYVTIYMGEGASDIGRELQRAGLVRSAQVFEIYVFLHNYR